MCYALTEEAFASEHAENDTQREPECVKDTRTDVSLPELQRYAHITHLIAHA